MSNRLLVIFMDELRKSAVAAGREEILVSDVECAIAAVESDLVDRRGVNPALLRDEP